MIVSRPTVVLVRPQLGENIGLTLRAMANFNALDLRLVGPRDGWPLPSAVQAAAGGDLHVHVTVYPDLTSALADRTHAVAVTARKRDMKKTWLPFTQKAFQTTLHKDAALVFGPEKAGLTNEDISLCHQALSIPTNPDFPSLNLSHAVAVCLSLFCGAPPFLPPENQAPGDRVHHLLMTLEHLLDRGRFFTPPEKAEKMRHNLRDLLLRAPLSSDDVNTWFGVVHTLAGLGDKSSK